MGLARLFPVLLSFTEFHETEPCHFEPDYLVLLGYPPRFSFAWLEGLVFPNTSVRSVIWSLLPGTDFGCAI